MKKLLIAFLVFVIPLAFAQECGDLICDDGEDTLCPEDCMVVELCGDGFCDPYAETYESCPSDCTESDIVATGDNETNATIETSTTMASGTLPEETTTTTVEDTTTTMTVTTTLMIQQEDSTSLLIAGAVIAIAAICGIAYYFIQRKSPAKEKIRKLYEEG